MKLPIAEIIEWDVLNWSQLIRYWHPIIEQLPANCKVLAIGERNGGLTTWLALLGHKVVCTDREFPTEKARLDHQRLGVAENVTYVSLDVVNCEWQTESFDLIIGKSVIGGLKADPSDRKTRSFEVQQKAVNHIYELLKPRGYFLSAENMHGAWLMRYYRKIRNKEKGWRYLTWNELDELYVPFRLKQVKAFGIFPTNFRSVVLNHTFFFLNKYIFNCLPRRYKYISFVAAQKINQQQVPNL